MGKRSDFLRIPKDEYPTIDPRAVPPLLPHLTAGARYAEPFAGDGQLIGLLDPYIELAWASDISPRTNPRIHENDGLQVGLGRADLFITNPPWSRPILHKAIVHLSNQAPTWMLFDSSWAFTKQAIPYLQRCRKIVAVGRLIWIEGTKTQGKDDCSWYCFHHHIPGSTPTFYGRGLPAERQVNRQKRVCADCGRPLTLGHKWSLQPRGSFLTPCHIYCDNPTSRRAKGLEPLPAAPLLDWRAA